MDSRERDYLKSLLLALFDGDELERFVRHHYGTRISLRFDEKMSLVHRVEELVEHLSKYEMVDDQLFDKLLVDRPKHLEQIQRVRKSICRGRRRGPGTGKGGQRGFN